MNLILEERLRQSMTQKRLAHEAGIAARTLRKLERGEEVSLETVRAVRRVLGMKNIPSGGGQPHRLPLNSPTPLPRAASLVAKDGPWWERGTKAYGRVSLVGLAFVFAFVVSILGFAGWAANDVHQSNAKFEVRTAAECSPESKAGIGRRLEAALPGSTLRHISSSLSTVGCTVYAVMRVPGDEQTMMREVKATGLDAKIDFAERF